ncbi:MAG: PAS domain-containing sensor histidine kinase [Nitrospiraceae bacterium]
MIFAIVLGTILALTLVVAVIFITTRGIRRRAEADKALQESERRLRGVIDNAAVLVYVKDLHGKYLLVNREFERVFHVAAHEILGKTDDDIFPKVLSETFRSHDQQVLEAATSIECEETVLRDDGLHTFLSTKFPLFETAGIPCAIGGVSIDITERKRGEDAVQHRIGELTDFYNKAPCGYHALNKDGVFVAVNDTELAWLGRRRDEIVGKMKFTELITPESRAVLKDRYAHFMERGWVRDLECHIVRPDGTSMPVLLNGLAMRDEAGNSVSSRFTLFDMTHRKRVEEEARRSHAFLTSIVDNIPNMIFVKDAQELRFLRFNKAGEELLGWPREVMIGKNDYDFFPPAEADTFTAKDREALEGGCVVDIPEEPIQTRYRGVRFLHTKKIPIVDEAGWPQYLLGISEDITDRRRAEETRARLAAIVESSDDAMIARTLNGDVVSWNHGAERMYGYTAAEVIGTPPTFLVPSDRLDEESQIMARLQRGERVVCETIRRRKDGHNLHVSLSVSPIKDGHGHVIGTATVARDISERKHAETQIRLHAAHLEAVNMELEAFSYSVSHDLRAPLRHIDGYAELLQKHASSELDEKGHRYLAMISKSAKQMGRLIDDLLLFSRVSRSEMQQAPVNLNQLVMHVIDELQPDIEGRQIDWTVDALPQVRGDRAMLRQVLSNLIGNAVKYTQPRQKAMIEIGQVTTPDGEIAVFVRDNGVGFDMNYAHKLFGVFQRLHSSSHFEGTGIGLANVRRIINRHGGRTWAEGAVDAGATFYFSLPNAEAEV